MAHCEPGIVNLWNLCGGKPFWQIWIYRKV